MTFKVDQTPLQAWKARPVDNQAWHHAPDPAHLDQDGEKGIWSELGWAGAPPAVAARVAEQPCQAVMPPHASHLACLQAPHVPEPPQLHACASATDDIAAKKSIGVVKMPEKWAQSGAAHL